MEWFRWFEGSTNDPKFAVVARRTGHPVAFVLAVWAQLLERASASDDRGAIDGFDCEGADVSLGLPEGAACAIMDALKAKGLIDDYRICKWEQRQPKREREPEVTGSSTERVRRMRAKKQEESNGYETACNDHVTPVTACNGHVTPVTTRNSLEEKRVEENKKEERKTDTSYLAQSSADAASVPEVTKQPEPIVAVIPLVDGSDFEVPVSLATEFATAYPAVDIRTELARARAWCVTNSRNRKTRSGVRRFLNSWLSRAQDKAPVSARDRPYQTARQAEAEERGEWAAKFLNSQTRGDTHGQFELHRGGAGEGFFALPAA